jgi:3-dehydroquinate synthase
MSYTLKCQIPRAILSYDIEMIPHLLIDPRKVIQFLLPKASKFVIFTDSTVAGLYGEALYSMLFSYGLNALIISFEGGEAKKNRATKEFAENQMLEQKCGRDTCLIAVGGGIVTDLGGYIAATYCRGIPLVLIPTTLLAMVDASIGGKVGVNTDLGKNMIGCFYPPVKVWIDPSTLQTLPLKELKNGLVEMIKHALIADPDYFTYLEESSKNILSSGVPEFAIFRSCEIKKEIVEEDEKETGKRHLLNFGHTIGHALETVSGYSVSHGHAVAIGLVAESYLSLLLGLLSEFSFVRILKIFEKYEISLSLEWRPSPKMLLNAMVCDKKSLNGVPRFVLIKDVGEPVVKALSYCSDVDQEILKKTLDWVVYDLCCR